VPMPDMNQIRAYILDKLGAAARSDVADSAHLVDDFGLDSFGFLTLVTSVEEHFGVELDLLDADPAEFLTLGGLIRCIGSCHSGEPT
jgi:acyl carrier protein